MSFLSIGHFCRGILLFYTLCNECDRSERAAGLVQSIVVQAAFEVSEDVFRGRFDLSDSTE